MRRPRPSDKEPAVLARIDAVDSHVLVLVLGDHLLDRARVLVELERT
jgi:hypothetical protein